MLYQGEAVVDLSDRNFVEMFWRDYRIEPRSPEAREIIENESFVAKVPISTGDRHYAIIDKV